MLFVPRQVALAAAASSSHTPAAAAPAMAKEEPKKEKKSKGKSKAAAAKETAAAAAAVPPARAAVVASVAAFLEAGGFARTLDALRSEADLEEGAWRSSPVNLEELVAKFLDSSNPTPVAVTEENNEQDKTSGDVAEEAGKKKKKVKKTDAEAGESEKRASELPAQEKPSENVGAEGKEKKQKKKKDDSSTVNAGSDEATETVKNDDQKPDGKKKKKSKKQEKDDDDVEVRLEKVELAITKKFEAAEKLNGDGDKSGQEEPKVQDDDDKNNGVVEKKKKTKDKSATEADDTKGKSSVVDTVKNDNKKKEKKKRKKSDPEENVQVEGKEVAGKDSVPKPEDENKSGMEIEEGDNGKPSNENAVTGKKRKLEEVKGSNTTEEDNTANNQSLTNGFAEKTGQDSNIKPSKRQKHSSEPKTVNAFQRVKLENVKFADERLQDNSYWAKGGADTGYGAKAQEILGQVRGRGFRHEKTKKKRGTYRGGQIDLQTHSIKFENSDDE
nr:unnamed protein product [Digitaria exilis]